ncbi:hypothetical protein B0H19DRAFT_1172454 [Mycena capillaripes]|nr:hypothetical protein B0H19DRAFT_1172454 [Mycena capillaripes]
MQMQRRPRRRLFASLAARERPKESPINVAALTRDALRTSLELVKESSDICPPLKSALGGVVALCDLADRVAASNVDAATLAWRAVAILDTIYNAVDIGPDLDAKVPPQLLQNILQFEQLLSEIRTAMMKSIARKGCFRRVLHLRRNESDLAQFTTSLDSAAQVFTIGTLTAQTASLSRIEDAVEKVSMVSSALEQSNIHLRNQVTFLQLTVVFLE